MLAAMFSERWDGCHKLDKEGRVFLDYSPYCFGKILEYLRSKSIEQAEHNLQLPGVDREYQGIYITSLSHLGLSSQTKVDQNVHEVQEVATEIELPQLQEVFTEIGLPVLRGG